MAKKEKTGPNWPSKKEGKPSGPKRDNNPPKNPPKPPKKG